jgi:hypothetical protein
MRASVFVGTSLDGFIARLNGDLDFLPPGGGEPHGYDEFIASVDAIVIGRQTFETVLTMKPWPYGDKRVVVLSSRSVEFSAVVGGVVEQMAGSPAEIVAQLAATGGQTPLHRWWNHNSTVPARRIDSTSDHHSRARAHWRRNFSLWLLTTRHSPPSYRDQALPERFGEQRVRC